VSKKYLYHLGLIFILLGCTTLTKEEYQTTNWFEMGKAAGVSGRPASSVSGYQQSCSKHGIQVNQKKYEKGRSEGLKLYCTYESGHSIGLSGKTYSGVCPAAAEGSFLKGFHFGRKEYELQEKERELQEREANLRAAELASATSSWKKCSFDSDCKIESSCQLHVCENTKRKCTFDSDCEIPGKCESKSYEVGGRHYTGSFCRF